MDDLTTVDIVKEYLGIDIGDSASDSMLARLVASESSWFRSQTQRDITVRRYTEVRNGNGQRSMSPYQYPIASVQSLVIDDVTVPPWIPPAIPGSLSDPGWTLSLDAVWCINYNGMYEPFAGDYGPYFLADPLSPRFIFTKGFGNVAIQYTAGYVERDNVSVPGTPDASGAYRLMAAEFFTMDLGVFYAGGDAQVPQPATVVIPLSAPFQWQAPAGFTTDVSVTIGTRSFTPVPRNPLPTQYAVDNGVYLFNSADAGASLSVTYLGATGALTRVASAPTVGQYMVGVGGSYSFNAADANRSIVIAYGTVPSDIVQAVTEKVAWEFKKRDRIGQRSKVVGGESITFMVDSVSQSTQDVISSYARRQLG